MLHALKKLLRTVFIFYSCICLAGCVTSKLLDYAEQTAEIETLHWKVEAVTFAAIRDNHFVRLCLKLSSPSDTSIAGLSIDLQEMNGQLINQPGLIGKFEDGLNTQPSICNYEYEIDEKALPISIVHSDETSIADAMQVLNQELVDEQTVILLQHNSGNYLVFRSPAGMYECLDRHAIGSYNEIEHHYSPGVFILMPLVVVVDAVLITAMIIITVICAIPFLLPLCIPLAIVTGKGKVFNPEYYEGEIIHPSDEIYLFE